MNQQQAERRAPPTQGPLHVTREVDAEGEAQHTVRAATGLPLAVLSNYSALEQKANADLYAAAPVLLEAAIESLKLLRKGANGWGVSKDLLAAAIFKATGRAL